MIIPIDEIYVPDFRIRSEFNDESEKEIFEKDVAQDLINPLTVQDLYSMPEDERIKLFLIFGETDKRYLLIDGQNRLEAIKKSGAKKVPVEIVKYKKAEDVLKKHLTLNPRVRRENYKELAMRLFKNLGYSKHQLAKLFNVSVRTIWEWLKSMDLEPDELDKEAEKAREELKEKIKAKKSPRIEETSIKEKKQIQKPEDFGGEIPSTAYEIVGEELREEAPHTAYESKWKELKEKAKEYLSSGLSITKTKEKLIDEGYSKSTVEEVIGVAKKELEREQTIGEELINEVKNKYLIEKKSPKEIAKELNLSIRTVNKILEDLIPKEERVVTIPRETRELKEFKEILDNRVRNLENQIERARNVFVEIIEKCNQLKEIASEYVAIRGKKYEELNLEDFVEIFNKFVETVSASEKSLINTIANSDYKGYLKMFNKDPENLTISELAQIIEEILK